MNRLFPILTATVLACCMSCQKDSTTNKPIITGDASNITYVSAQITSYVNVDTFTEIGIVVSKTNEAPMNKGDGCSTYKSVDLVGNQYDIVVNSLRPGIKYYYRAYYVANNAYNYADVKSFTTTELTASVLTKNATDIQPFSATLHGECVFAGTGKYMYYFEYSTVKSVLEDGRYGGGQRMNATGENGEFSLTLSCTPDKTYYYRAVFHHIETDVDFYGEILSFKTPEYLKKLTLDSVVVNGKSAIVSGEVEWGEGIVGELCVVVAQGGGYSGDDFVTVRTESGRYSITYPYLRPNKKCVAYVGISPYDGLIPSDPFYSEQIFSIQSVKAKMLDTVACQIEITLALDKQRYSEEFNTNRIVHYCSFSDENGNQLFSLGGSDATTDIFVDGQYSFSFADGSLEPEKKYQCEFIVEPHGYGYHVTIPYFFTVSK